MKIKLSKKISKDKICCLLCPHLCDLKEGRVGKCLARHNKDGKIRHVYLGSISCLAVESIKKKSFKHPKDPNVKVLVPDKKCLKGFFLIDSTAKQLIDPK